MSRDDILTLLRAHRQEIENLGIQSLRLFGSTARGEATSGSDIDLLVDFSTVPTFSELYMELRIFLEDLLGKKVDLVTETGLRDRVRPVRREGRHSCRVTRASFSRISRRAVSRCSALLRIGPATSFSPTSCGSTRS